jgi:hypothetical protein
MLVFAPKNAYTWCKNGIFDCFGKAKEMAFQESLERRFFVALRQKNPRQKMLKNLCFERLFACRFLCKNTSSNTPKKARRKRLFSPLFM